MMKVHTGGKQGTSSQLHVSNPKESPGRQAFGKGMTKQNCATVRAELRKTGGKLEGPRKRA